MILSRNNKNDLIKQIARELKVDREKNIPNTTYIFNRPMTYSQICRNKKYMRVTRTLFALYISIASRLFNIHSESMPIFQKICLVILYFSFTLIFIYQNFTYFKTIMIKYHNYKIPTNATQCALAEISRNLHYISLPLMFTLVIFERNQNILLLYVVSICMLFLSNMFDKYDGGRNTVPKLTLFISTIIICDILFSIEIYLEGPLGNFISILILPSMIFCSIFLATQIKCLDNVIEIPFKNPSWINQIPDCFFYTTLYLSILYQVDILNIPIVCINVLLSIASLYKPFLFNSFQLYVEDKQNKKILKNLETIFSMFKLLDISYTSFKEYRENLQLRMKEIEAENLFKGLIEYLGNVKSSEPENLIKAIEDFSKLKPNKNIIFVDGLFVYLHFEANFIYTNRKMKEKFSKKEPVELKLERLRNCILIQYLLKKYSHNKSVDIHEYIEKCIKKISKETE